MLKNKLHRDLKEIKLINPENYVKLHKRDLVKNVCMYIAVLYEYLTRLAPGSRVLQELSVRQAD
jgi:hypothetical protein